jgi:hypothetical protein
MNLEKKLLQEIERFNFINSYINEQEAPPPPPPPPPAPGDAAAGEVPPPAPGDAAAGGAEDIPEPVDVAADPDVEVVGDEGAPEETPEDEGGSEELDITELVDAQKNISDKQDEYMEGLFSKIDELSEKLNAMDGILSKIDSIEQKIEKYRNKTPEEKLQLRSLDSYPYNQKLSDFFMDKKDDFEATGKNEYVLTDDEVQNYTERDIRNSFDEPFKNLNNNY